jgi:uncharacterized protein
MRSHLLVGHVEHRRTGRTPYQLRQRVYYLALDLDEVRMVRRHVRLLRQGRLAPFAFRERDHWSPPATDLRASVHGHLRDQGIDPRGWRILLIANMRVLGYVFDPASFYLCRDAEGVLRVVIVEVHNTYGERHLYTLRVEPRGSGHVGAMIKGFHVSPFLDMEARYTVRVQDEPGRVHIAVVEREPDGTGLVATLGLRRTPLTDRAIVRLALRVPLVTHRTMAAIHWHAWRLWRRGARFQRHPGWSR